MMVEFHVQESHLEEDFIGIVIENEDEEIDGRTW